MGKQIDLELPVCVYRVGDTAFSDDQVAWMITRTNCKLKVARIRVVVEKTVDIAVKTLAYVDDVEGPQQNIYQLLAYGAGPVDDKTLRIFLVKNHIRTCDGSWTYDPVDEPDDEYLWGGAIFITELYNDNSDECYYQLGYPETSDSLLHELGHVLMQQKEHYDGPYCNFLHIESAQLDDTIFADQIERMRQVGSETYRYLRPIESSA